nr:SH3 domain-containing protein C23A1.17-like [Lolium perenne]
MTSAASLPASAAAASLPVASSTSTTPAMTSSSTTATVSPFLAALLAGTAPPPLVPPPISTRPAGSLFTNGAEWPFSALVSPLALATTFMAPPSAPSLSGPPSVVPPPAPAAPAPITASSGVPNAPGTAAFQPPLPAGSASLVPYGAGLYGQPLFYGMSPLSYGPHSPPPPTPVVATAPAVVPVAVSDAASSILSNVT